MTKLSKDRKNVGCKWVFCTKNDALGEIIRYKARLVAKRYSYVASVDFDETFSFVTKFITIRCIIALRTAMDWKTYQMYVEITYLNGILEVEIYMYQPEGFVWENKEDLLYNFNKALYGLKQSPNTWYNHINSFFIKKGFCKSQAEHSLYDK